MLFRRAFLLPMNAVVRELVLAKNVEAPDLVTVKDFLRFHAAAGKGMIVEQTTCDSLNTFAEWFFAGFTRVTDTEINKNDRSEVYDVSIFHHLMARPDLILPSGFEKSCLRKASSSISRGQSIILPNAMFGACYEPHGRRTIRSLFLSVTGSSFTIFFLKYCWTRARLSAFFTGGLRYEVVGTQESTSCAYTNLLVEHVRLPHRLRRDCQGRALAHARETVRDVDLQRLRLKILPQFS